MSQNEFLKKQKRLKELDQMYASKPYAVRYQAFFWMCLALAALFQTGSALSSGHYWQSQAGLFFEHAAVSLAIAALFVGATEAVKHFAWNRYFSDRFGENPANRLLLAVAIVASTASLYFSVVGGGMYVNLSPDVEAVTTRYDQQREHLRQQFVEREATIAAEIQAIHDRSTWNGRTYIVKRDSPLLLEKESRLQKVRDQLEADLAALKAEEQQAIGKLQGKERSGQWLYMYCFALFDLLFLACTAYKHFYQSREREALMEELLPQHDPLNNNGKTVPINGRQVRLPHLGKA